MAFVRRATALVFLICIGQAQASVINLNPYYANDNSISAPSGVSQLISASNGSSLIAMTSNNISVTNVAGGSVLDEAAFKRFTSMSLSPSGNYLYAADFGGEVIGYGSPSSQSYVHQYNLTTGQWNAELSPIAYQIQATGDSNFILSTSDQWVTLSTNTWTNALGTSQQGSVSWSVYEGNIVYDANTQRLIHGNEGLSSQELTAFHLVNGQLVRQETSGTYGTAQGHGGTLALSNDGSSIYYGNLKVDALDVSHNLMVFPEQIYAANAKYAFGNGSYYDAKTGVLLGKLGFNSTVYALDGNGDSFWAYDGTAGLFRHFVSSVPETSTYAMMGLGLIAMGLVRRKASRPQQAGSTTA